MSKREFLQQLEEQLAYDLPERMVMENLEFYDRYIDTETASGKSAALVLEELGDPRLIAKSIVEAARSGADGIPGSADDQDFSGEIYGREVNTKTGQSGFFSGSENSGTTRSRAFGDQGEKKKPRSLGWVLLAVVCVLLVVVWLVLKVLGPVLVPVLLILLVSGLIFRNRK